MFYLRSGTMERDYSISFLRVIATIAVLVLHVSAVITYYYGDIPIDQWQAANLYHSFTRFCVPVFFMISGVLLIDRNHTVVGFWKNRLAPIVIPFLFWSVIYIVFDHWDLFTDASRAEEFLDLFLSKLLSGGKYHLWFVYEILGIYLLLPIISPWLKKASKIEAIYIIALCIVANALQYFISIFSYSTAFEFTFFRGYIFYFVIGYFINKYYKISYVAAINMIIVGCALTLFGTYFLSERQGTFNALFYKYKMPNVFLQSVGIFIVSKKEVFSRLANTQIFKMIDTYSYGIYLVHILILFFLNWLGLNWQFAHPAISIPIISLCCLALSTIMIHLMRQIPLLKRVCG